MAAEALQHRLLQERQGRRRHQERATDDELGGEGEAVQGRAGDDLEGCAVGAARRREAAVGAQQEAFGRLRDPGCFVQFHGDRPEVNGGRTVRR